MLYVGFWNRIRDRKTYDNKNRKNYLIATQNADNSEENSVVKIFPRRVFFLSPFSVWKHRPWYRKFDSCYADSVSDIICIVWISLDRNIGELTLEHTRLLDRFDKNWWSRSELSSTKIPIFVCKTNCSIRFTVGVSITWSIIKNTCIKQKSKH